MRQDDLMRQMSRAGIRLDDAATAARIAVQAHRNERNNLIIASRGASLTIRQIGAIFGLSHVQVLRVVRAASRDVPAQGGTVRATPS